MIGLLAILTVAALALAIERAVRRAFRRASMRHAQACEDDAARLLERLGYEVLGRQVRTSFDLAVDGQRVPVELRADYVVALGERRFVAEVKSGRRAPRIETATTRRQLLEYRMAFDVDGVLLVDGETSRVSEIVFDVPSLRAIRARSPHWASPFAAGAVVGAALATILLRYVHR